MRFPATAKVTAYLRERNRLIRPNNQKIDEWVDEYFDRCITNGESVTILTQWCVSKSLEFRQQQQGGCLVPTRKERTLFETEIPKIASAFTSNGIQLNWWITFNRSFLDSRRVAISLEAEYKNLIIRLAQPLTQQGWLLLADWEDDILGSRPQPNPEVLASIERFVDVKALEVEMRWNATWTQQETGLTQTADELRRDVYFQIVCEAEEGRLLTSGDSPFGEFILMPLEVPEQYDFFTILAPSFKKRIVSVLPPYPWRLKDVA